MSENQLQNEIESNEIKPQVEQVESKEMVETNDEPVRKSKQVLMVESWKSALKNGAEEFKRALPKHIPIEKFVRVAETAILSNPSIMDCSKQSVLQSLTKAAQDGLLIDGREAAIVTFNNKGIQTAQYMPMIGGILKKVRNSGELASITSEIVHKNDKFSYKVTQDGQTLEHEPEMFEDRGPMIGAYAVAKTKDNFVYMEVMSSKQVSDVKNVSRSKNNGPWSGAFESEMWRKTVIRRLSKRLPMSTDLEQLFKNEDDLFMPDSENELKEVGQKKSLAEKLM